MSKRNNDEGSPKMHLVKLKHLFHVPSIFKFFFRQNKQKQFCKKIKNNNHVEQLIQN